MTADGMAKGGGADGLAAEEGENGPALWSVPHLQTIIDRRLRLLLPSQSEPPQMLHMAMGYAVLSPGKRMRPILAMLTSFQFGRRDLVALDAACAIEMIHAASLIMDDLPAMDNAELRRGHPTAHRKFGEDIALLASIALLNQAFVTVSGSQALDAEARVRMVATLAEAVGSAGLVGGQVMDLRARSANVGSHDLERLNGMKTGALFIAAAEAGAIAAGADSDAIDRVRRLAGELGLAFQIADDVLDDPTFTGVTGKDTGKDAGKPTLASVLGPDGARALFHEHAERCRSLLDEIGARGAPLGVYVEQCLAQARL